MNFRSARRTEGHFPIDACNFGAAGDQQLGQTSHSIKLSVDIEMLGLQGPPPVCQFLETG